MPLLEVDSLKVHFHGRRAGETVRAVDGVSLAVRNGESVGLVGESGCGKTTVANTLVGLVRPTEGTVRFDGQIVGDLTGSDLRAFRRHVQMVFQDPFGSLNPRLTVGSAIAEAVHVHGRAGNRSQQRARVAELLRTVGLEPEYALRYPHEFSGGQRQRIGIARALAVEPSLLIADEPVSALDVSVQVQILNLIADLRQSSGIACLLIAHDLTVVRYMCDRVLVMYLGRIVEQGPTEEVFAQPSHPYTEALLSAVPDVEKGLLARTEGTARIILKGEVPSPTGTIPGCPFHPRCHRRRDICAVRVPPVVDVGPTHTGVCHFADDL